MLKRLFKALLATILATLTFACFFGISTYIVDSVPVSTETKLLFFVLMFISGLFALFYKFFKSV